MKVALITGASSGIGADAARHLSNLGYRIILVARRAAQLERVAQSIGGDAAVEVCDASSGEEVLVLAGHVRQEYGVPDVIVNCAGVGQWKRIEDTTPDDALVMVWASYLAAFNVTQAFMCGMFACRAGIVIHVNSYILRGIKKDSFSRVTPLRVHASWCCPKRTSSIIELISFPCLPVWGQLTCRQHCL